MLLTLLEIPVILLYQLTTAVNPALEKLIYKINKRRKKSLRDWGKEEWVWEQWDGEENKYTYLEKQVTKCNLTFLGLFVLIVVGSLILDYFGITLD